MIDKVRADDRALAGEKIENTGRDPGFLENFHQHRAANRRLLGRFHDDGVAGDERGRNHSAHNRDRKIPRRDDERDAARPVMMIALLARNMLR